MYFHFYLAYFKDQVYYQVSNPKNYRAVLLIKDPVNKSCTELNLNGDA